ncbi:MAG: BamA/TamA family outer membrane protein [Candidatus Aminicenantes bacterium]|nr:MAG: BamA/TamA family outer membrane protein [Candidatus Aminicenantes bacterium]
MKKDGLALILKYERDSRVRNRKLAFFCRFCLCLLFILLPLDSVSQSLNSSPLIASVSVVVDEQSAGEELERLIPIKTGEPFSFKRINSSIKQIYRTGLFSEVQVAREGEQEVHLTFYLKRKLVARRIIFQTKEKLPRATLKENLLSLREGTFFSEPKLERAVQELKEILAHEGFFNPEIEAFTKKDLKSSSFDVFFRIVSFRKYMIKEINFTGEMVIPEDELKREMKSQEGKEYIPSLLEDDITRLKELLYSKEYQRAEIEAGDVTFNEREGNVSLSLNILPHEKIVIEVRGARIPLQLLRPIWESQIFEEWGLAEGKAKILNYMRKKGFLFASVTSSIQKENNTMRVIHTVTPNKKFDIIGVSYNGLDYFTPSQLEAELAAGKGTSLKNWIDGEMLFRLPEEMKSLYKSRGFPDAQVDFVFLRKGGKGVEVQFQIQEGNQQKIKSISFMGAQRFNSGDLFEQINSFEDGPFFSLNIQKDIEKLETLYLNQGFRGTEIAARVEEVEEDLFSVSFMIKEGEKVRIEKIVVTGNVVTDRKTILRELRVKEDDYAYSNRISESKRRLEKLGIFTTVKIEEISLSSESENLVINVREGQRNYAGLGLGIESETKLREFAVWNSPFRLRGIGEIIRSNVFGSAGQASLVGQLSPREKRIVLTWEQPYFFGLPLQTFLNGWLEEEARESFTFYRQGVSLTTIKPVSEKTLLLATLQWAETTLTELQVEPNEVDRQFSEYSATSVSGSVIWDGRDDLFNPERGSFFSFVLERAFPLFEEESDYLKSFFKSQHFVTVLPGLTFSLTSRLGLGGGKQDIPIHERFFAGGSNSFRGARFDELGPVDEESGKPVGGEALLLLNLELTFPLVSGIKNLRGAVFYDIGNVFPRAKDISLASLENAAGFGLRYKTPFGPVRLELGWNLDVPQEERKVRFYITIGNVF